MMKRKADPLTILESAERSASGDTKTDPIHIGDSVSEIIFFLEATAKSGSPTLDVSIVTQNPVTETWHSLETFTQLTNAGTQMKVKSSGIGKKLAVVYTIGGTSTPKITFGLYALLK